MKKLKYKDIYFINIIKMALEENKKFFEKKNSDTSLLNNLLDGTYSMSQKDSKDVALVVNDSNNSNKLDSNNSNKLDSNNSNKLDPNKSNKSNKLDSNNNLTYKHSKYHYTNFL